jgi:hypothetical protein
MSSNHDLERRIADYYASEPPPRAPERVHEAARVTIDTTRQRRVVIRVPWRFPIMHGFARLAAAAVAVIAVGAVGLALFGPGASGIGGPASTPSPSPFASPSPSPEAAESPGAAYPPLTGSFTSDLFGISLAYPAGWIATPAQVPWDSNLQSDCEPACIDEIAEPGPDNAFIRIVAEPLAGSTGEAWMDEILADPIWEDTCPPTTEPVTIDGVAGLIAVHCPEAAVNGLLAAGGYGYLIVFYGDPDVAWFRQVLATVQLHPEDVGPASAAPSAS